MEEEMYQEPALQDETCLQEGHIGTTTPTSEGQDNGLYTVSDAKD